MPISFQSRLAVLASGHLVTKPFQDFTIQFRDGTLIVDKHDSAVPVGGDKGVLCLLAGLGFQAGQINPEQGTFPWSAVHGNRPSIPLHNAMDHRQSQSAALSYGLGGEIGVIDPLEDFGRHPQAGVPNAEKGIMAGLEARDGFCFLVCEGG